MSYIHHLMTYNILTPKLIPQVYFLDTVLAIGYSLMLHVSIQPTRPWYFCLNTKNLVFLVDTLLFSSSHEKRLFKIWLVRCGNTSNSLHFTIDKNVLIVSIKFPLNKLNIYIGNYIFGHTFKSITYINFLTTNQSHKLKLSLLLLHLHHISTSNNNYSINVSTRKLLHVNFRSAMLDLHCFLLICIFLILRYRKNGGLALGGGGGPQALCRS